ncbi:conserved membrane hypothetical protein [uncultured Microbacterium sp.]|uniref:DUF2809 domain-containing protein n=1 Tax=uncultured Microbacterium sp. TaxID=191216 RepID=A0A1Y5P7W0_9MICO|nr:conserved membrane hypothetical protein [uncultured Microbacterium sp.]
MTTRRATAVRRVVAAVLIVVAVAAGLFVHGALPDTAATDIAGDALYVVVVWGLVVMLAPRLPAPAVAGIVLVWCIAVELFQLTGLPEEWGAAFPPVMLVLGTVFDPRDLLIYAAATAVLLVADLAVSRTVTRSR